MNGTYIVFEGHDYVGKTTISELVQLKLQEELRASARYLIDVILTKHPGATPLGKHLRQLVKAPNQFDLTSNDIDPASAQVLMMVDQICFINTILEPKLEEGAVVMADRSNVISAIAYGLAEGIEPDRLAKVIRLAKSPMPDRVFILRVPWHVAKERSLAKTEKVDRFQDAGDDYMRRVKEIYDNLSTQTPEILVLLTDFIALERIEYIDATKPAVEVAEEIANKIKPLMAQKAASLAF